MIIKWVLLWVLSGRAREADCRDKVLLLFPTELQSWGVYVWEDANTRSCEKDLCCNTLLSTCLPDSSSYGPMVRELEVKGSFPNWSWVKTWARFSSYTVPGNQAVMVAYLMEQWMHNVEWILKVQFGLWNETMQEWAPIPGEVICKVQWTVIWILD